MIFATVGTQLPFDRLLSAVDTWAAYHADIPVVAQTGASTARFAHMTCLAHMDQQSFAARMAEARVIVAHAGMGTILQAAEAGKPLILMARRADLGEHRNDHQIATAAGMSVLSNVTVVEDATELAMALNRALQQTSTAHRQLPPTAQPQLIAAVKDFIWSDAPQGQPVPPALRRNAARNTGWARA